MARWLPAYRSWPKRLLEKLTNDNAITRFVSELTAKAEESICLKTKRLYLTDFHRPAP